MLIQMVQRRVILGVVATLYFAVVIWLAFMPDSVTNGGEWYWTFAVFGLVGILLLLIMGRRRWWAAIGFGALGAAWVEAGQSVWMPVGYASAMDVVLGSTGAIAGVLVTYALTAPHPAARPPKRPEVRNSAHKSAQEGPISLPRD
jgi:glycopeptide antibiotics resistance protein